MKKKKKKEEWKRKEGKGLSRRNFSIARISLREQLLHDFIKLCARRDFKLGGDSLKIIFTIHLRK